MAIRRGSARACSEERRRSHPRPPARRARPRMPSTRASPDPRRRSPLRGCTHRATPQATRRRSRRMRSAPPRPNGRTWVPTMGSWRTSAPGRTPANRRSRSPAHRSPHPVHRPPSRRSPAQCRSDLPAEVRFVCGSRPSDPRGGRARTRAHLSCLAVTAPPVWYTGHEPTCQSRSRRRSAASAASAAAGVLRASERRVRRPRRSFRTSSTAGSPNAQEFAADRLWTTTERGGMIGEEAFTTGRKP